MMFRRLPRNSTSTWKAAAWASSKGGNNGASFPQYNHLETTLNTNGIRRWSSMTMTWSSAALSSYNKGINISNPRDMRSNSTFSDNNTVSMTNAHQGFSRISIRGYQPLTTESTSSPFYNQLCAFDDNVNRSLMDREFTTPGFQRKNKAYNGGSTSPNLALFWDSITRSIHTYNELVGVCPEMNARRLSALINLIHNGLRINRFQLVKLNKKPDYDSKSFHHEMVKYLTTTLQSITQDILNHKIFINEYGLMHLLTSFNELGLTTEMIQLWDLAKKDDELESVFMQPKCLGVLLPVLYQHGTKLPLEQREEYDFTALKELYERSTKKLSFPHPNMLCGMIKTALFANEPRFALDLFDKLSDVVNAPNQSRSRGSSFNYLCDAHLSFIGDCKDINVAETFWQNALNGEMPYRINLQVSAINSFLTNIWNETQDFNKIVEVWSKMITNYTKNNLNIGVFSSLNNTFMALFFNGKYKTDKIAGFQELDNLLNIYQTLRPIDETLLNIILTKCSLSWRDKAIYDHIKKLYKLYDIPETIVSKRILLRSLGALDMTPQEIWDQWIDLILKVDSMGQKFIANADWAAIRDATLLGSETNIDDSKKQALAKLYVQVVQLFKEYCRDPVQYRRISKILIFKYPILRQYWEDGKFQEVDTQGLVVPELQSLHRQG